MTDVAVDSTVPPPDSVRSWIGHLWLKAFGWHVSGGRPNVRKAVVVAAPHTSNWDLTFTLALSYALGVKISWIGKHTLFKPPLGWVMSALDGIAVDRRGRHGAVDAIVEVINAHDDLLLIIPPEGTRSRSDKWKTGFYYIALGAKVPIILGFLDYGRKCGGLGTVFYPSGNPQEDVEVIRAFYKDIRGKFPENESTIRFEEAPAT